MITENIACEFKTVLNPNQPVKWAINTQDPLGLDAIWVQEAHSAKVFGHSGLVVQDGEGEWYYFFWGPLDESLSSELITGTKTNSYCVCIGGPETDMSSTEKIIEAISMAPEQASGRAPLITDTFYFEGDYTATYEKAKQIAESSESYQLLTNNCVQKTLIAFIASDSNFCLVEKDAFSSIIPNEAAVRVSMLPKQKNAFPWVLLLYDLFCNTY